MSIDLSASREICRAICFVERITRPPGQCYFLKISGFRRLGGRRPLNTATILLAAIKDIFVRVSIDAEAICGVSTTFERGDESRFFDDGPARCVDEECRRLHAEQFGSIKEAARFGK